MGSIAGAGVEGQRQRQLIIWQKRSKRSITLEFGCVCGIATPINFLMRYGVRCFFVAAVGGSVVLHMVGAQGLRLAGWFTSDLILQWAVLRATSMHTRSSSCMCHLKRSRPTQLTCR